MESYKIKSNSEKTTWQERLLVEISSNLLLNENLRQRYINLSKKRILAFDENKIIPNWFELLYNG